MTKADIINEIVKSTGFERTEVQQIVEAFKEQITYSMLKGKNVYFRGFGSFVVKKRAAKTARNISKNTTIIIPAHYVPIFKPVQSFKNAVSINVNDGKFGNMISKYKNKF